MSDAVLERPTSTTELSNIDRAPRGVEGKAHRFEPVAVILQNCEATYLQLADTVSLHTT